MSDLVKGSYFPEELVTEMFNKVRGHSSLAKLCPQSPVSFNGIKEFTFSMDKEIDIVAEKGAKSNGGAAAVPVTIVPIKVEYGTRVSDEFKYAAEEEQLNYLQSFSEGFARKVAKGLDIMAFHGLNPRTTTASTVIGTNCFDSAVTNTVNYVAASADSNIEAAIALVEGNEYDVNGLAMSTTMRSALAALTANGVKLFPELAWGQNPGTINGLASDVNSTVSKAATNADVDHAIVGDYTAFKWGFAKQIPLEIIEYGNPDNDEDAGDLKGHNQIYLRAEAYIGWAILDPAAFARVKA